MHHQKTARRSRPTHAFLPVPRNKIVKIAWPYIICPQPPGWRRTMASGHWERATEIMPTCVLEILSSPAICRSVDAGPTFPAKVTPRLPPRKSKCHRRRGFQRRTHRYLCGGQEEPPCPDVLRRLLCAMPAWCRRSRAGRRRRPLRSLTAEWPTELGRSPRRPCPVAGPEGVGWEGNLGMGWPGKSAADWGSAERQEKQEVL